MSISNPKRVRQGDVAKAANVSISAVSKAFSDSADINEETRRHILAVGRELGYVARSSRGATKRDVQYISIGVVLMGVSMTDDVVAKMLAVSSEFAQDRGQRLHYLTLDTELGYEEETDRIVSFAEPLDGIVITGVVMPNTVHELERRGVPHVFLGDSVDINSHGYGERRQTISFDHIQAGRSAAGHLFKSGHRRVGLISEFMREGYCHDLFRCGYILAHDDFELPYDRSLVSVAGQLHADMRPIVGALAELADPPTALVIPDCRVGSNVVRALADIGSPIGRDAIAMTTCGETARKYGVEDVNLIDLDDGLLTKVCLEHLIRVIEQPPSHTQTIRVPCDFRPRQDSKANAG